MVNRWRQTNEPASLVYLPWIDSITHVKPGENEELELRLNSNYEKVWRVLKQRLDEPAVRLKSQYSSRLYQWAKQVRGSRIQASKLSYFTGRFWGWSPLRIIREESFRKHRACRRREGLA